MLDAGAGEREINTILSALNTQTVAPATLKRHERVVGEVTEELAKKSCEDAIEEEKKLTLEYRNK